MDPALERELKEIRALVEDNNRMLQSVRRDAMIKSVVSIIWIAVMVGLPILVYFVYIEPQLRTIGEATKSLQTGQGGEMPEALKTLLDAYMPR